MGKQYNVAVIGNPNSGKTTLFNRLCAESMHTGNWPGVTVEQHLGRLCGAEEITLVDLPGIYSLVPFSPEEEIALEYFLFGQVDLILCVVDATNIERSLYLAMQLLGSGKPVILVLNQMDVVAKNGGYLDVERLSERIDCICIPVSARYGDGVPDVVNTVQQACKNPDVYVPRKRKQCLSLGLEHTVHHLSKQVCVCPEWLTERLLIDSGWLMKRMSVEEGTQVVFRQAAASFEVSHGRPLSDVYTERQYKEIEVILAGIRTKGEKNRRCTERIDHLLLNRIWAYPVFLSFVIALMWVTYGYPGRIMMSMMEQALQAAGNVLSNLLVQLRVSPGLCSFITDGMFAGVGSVIVFLPVLTIMYLLMAILEECGYMARIAFLMDRPMRTLGLNGRCFIPLIMGFGCSVPAVLATRCITSGIERNRTMKLIPFMSCGAKLPVYLMISTLCFPEHTMLAVALTYMFGIALAVCTAWIGRMVQKNMQTEPFMMEMPSYRIPDAHNVYRQTQRRVGEFVGRVASLLLVVSCLCWLLKSLTPALQWTEYEDASILAAVSRMISPLLRPIGLGAPKIASALFFGVLAKEGIVSALAVASDGMLKNLFPTQASAVSFMVFVLLYSPCVGALAAIRRETGRYTDAMTMCVKHTLLAWYMAWIAYKVVCFFA